MKRNSFIRDILVISCMALLPKILQPTASVPDIVEEEIITRQVQAKLVTRVSDEGRFNFTEKPMIVTFKGPKSKVDDMVAAWDSRERSFPSILFHSEVNMTTKIEHI